MFPIKLWSVLFSTTFFTCAVHSAPCKTSDSVCIENFINNVLPEALSEHSELGVETSDPLFVEYVDGNLSILKYKLMNSTVIGYKQCKVSNIKLNSDLSSLQYVLNCPSLKMSGQYEISGRLIVLPVEGKGDYELICGQYRIAVDAELKKSQGADGKSHIGIKNFKLKNEALSPIKYDFKNLFNGQKDLSDAVHKFAHENWKEVANFVQDPVLYASLKKIISNMNKYFKNIPLDTIFEVKN